MLCYQWLGNCTFAEKVYNSQRAGAKGLIVMNFNDEPELIQMASCEDITKDIVIPSIFISLQ